MQCKHFTPWAAFALLLVLLSASFAQANEQPATEQSAIYCVTGLFSPDRQDDLRLVLQDFPEVTLVALDYDKAEATFRFDPAKAFPGAKPEQFVERFDNRLRSLSHSTFGIRPLSTVPRDKLERVEIAVRGLDCKGCSLGAYEAVYRIEGVEQATASFKLGLVTALIDPSKVNRAALEDALRQRNVHLPAASTP